MILISKQTGTIICDPVDTFQPGQSFDKIKISIDEYMRMNQALIGWWASRVIKGGELSIVMENTATMHARH